MVTHQDYLSKVRQWATPPFVTWKNNHEPTKHFLDGPKKVVYLFGSVGKNKVKQAVLYFNTYSLCGWVTESWAGMGWCSCVTGWNTQYWLRGPLFEWIKHGTGRPQNSVLRHLYQLDWDSPELKGIVWNVTLSIRRPAIIEGKASVSTAAWWSSPTSVMPAPINSAQIQSSAVHKDTRTRWAGRLQYYWLAHNGSNLQEPYTVTNQD